MIHILEHSVHDKVRLVVIDELKEFHRGKHSDDQNSQNTAEGAYDGLIS